MPKTPEYQRRAVARYDAKYSKRYVLKLNKRTDPELIALLDDAPNKSGLIKDALRLYLEAHPEAAKRAEAGAQCVLQEAEDALRGSM